MQRKRIGVLAAQIDENTQNLFMQGFLSEAFRLDYDVCTISMYLKYEGCVPRETGDSSIFDLIQHRDLFDAFVVLADTIQTPGVLNFLEDQLHSHFDAPVIVVDYESKYFASVHIDHYSPVRKLVDHLIDVHDYKDILFLNGFKDHPHSISRLNAYKDSLTAHNIEVKDDNIFYGNYWYDGGKNMAEELLASDRALPQAIACANDCMAIGVISSLMEHGIRVPEDVAVIGYDSIEEGRNNRVSITSADIPAKRCGEYCANWIDAQLNDRSLPSYDEFFSEASGLIIGSSCGCPKQIHSDFMDYISERTEAYTMGFFSYLNTMMDDLISQTTYEGFFNCVFQNTHQIRGFESFHLCLNDTWDVSKSMDNLEDNRKSFTNQMCRILRCTSNISTGNRISYDDTFEQALLLPELHEESEKPRSFIFTPLHFNENNFGYAVVSYGNEPRVYDNIYHLWLRNIMQALECFNRQIALSAMVSRMESTQIRDSLTGLYNLRGFLAQASDLCEASLFEGNEVLIVSLDVDGLSNINTNYGRKEGDRAIITLAQIVSDCVKSDELCARMANDEFIIATALNSHNEKRASEIITHITQRIEQYNNQPDSQYRLNLFFGYQSALVSNQEILEQLINEAITDKNAKKLLQQKSHSQQLTAEDIENDAIVADILDNNRLVYHFQPIVSAFSGEVFSYEALMRSNTDKPVSPFTIIQSAQRMNRLYDVEKATFFNVLQYIEDHLAEFDNRKIFINSIPSEQLENEDRTKLEAMLTRHLGMFVVELTESSELDDNTLVQLKQRYKDLNVDIAVDDYGSGFSNTNNLLRYMPRYLKIDRMLIQDIHTNSQKQYFVKSIVDFAHNNEILTLAEGVETSRELKEVIRLGVDLIQGYYTAKPQPTPIPQIDQRIVNEIIQYNQISNSINHKPYKAKPNDNISLLQLAMNKYTKIIMPGSMKPDSEIHIIGASGFHSTLSIIIEGGFKGTIYLHSVSLSAQQGSPCIEIQGDAEVTIILEDENELRAGGILVPENAKLTIDGPGSITINTSGAHHFGIGNGIKARHGDIILNQDGGISITSSGMHGFAIGSGLGGNIRIQRGWYRINMSGRESVAIGSVYGDDPIDISLCDMEIRMMTTEGVAIGSINGSTDISIKNSTTKFWIGSDHIAIIGSLSDKTAKIDLYSGVFIFNIRTDHGIAIGSESGDTNIKLTSVSVNIAIQGKQSYTLGNFTKTATINCYDCDLITNITNGFETDIGANEDSISITNSRCTFQLNGSFIKRTLLKDNYSDS